MALLAVTTSKFLFKTVAINICLLIAERASSYFFKRFKKSRNSRNSTAKHEKKPGIVVEEGICPICQKELKLDYSQKPEGEKKDDIELGIFMLQSCEHKFHYKCFQRFRLICKDCPVCSL